MTDFGRTFRCLPREASLRRLASRLWALALGGRGSRRVGWRIRVSSTHAIKATTSCLGRPVARMGGKSWMVEEFHGHAPGGESLSADEHVARRLRSGPRLHDGHFDRVTAPSDFLDPECICWRLEQTLGSMLGAGSTSAGTEARTGTDLLGSAGMISAALPPEPTSFPYHRNMHCSW